MRSDSPARSTPLLKAIESGKINFWVLPEDAGLNLTAPSPGSPSPVPTTTTTTPENG